MCIARSKSKKKEVESEWKLRAREFQKMEEREMILKEDGQIISGIILLLNFELVNLNLY